MRGTLKGTLVFKDKQDPPVIKHFRVYVSPLGGKLEFKGGETKPSPTYFVYSVLSASGENIFPTIENECKTQQEVFEVVKVLLKNKYKDFELILDEHDN